jgi:hypothetical protein
MIFQKGKRDPAQPERRGLLPKMLNKTMILIEAGTLLSRQPVFFI